MQLLAALFDCEEYLPEFSIVAELDGEIVGHVISTRGRAGELELLGLGPIGVVPRLQRHGIGTALMKENVARANAAGERGIALLGGPEYYSRFGFVPSTSLGVTPPAAGWGHALPAAPARRLAGRRQRNLPLRRAVWLPEPAPTGYHGPGAPVAQLAEAADLKSACCGFESHLGHADQAVRASGASHAVPASPARVQISSMQRVL